MEKPPGTGVESGDVKRRLGEVRGEEEEQNEEADDAGDERRRFVEEWKREKEEMPFDTAVLVAWVFEREKETFKEPDNLVLRVKERQQQETSYHTQSVPRYGQKER